MSQEEKQIFLRQNILDKGYDTNTFVEFMMNKKGGEEGADVSNWSMSELKIVVREFISLQEKSKNKPSLLNTYRNITDPLRQGQPKIPKVDNLNGNANNNQGSNQKNSSMTDFFVNQNAQNRCKSSTITTIAIFAAIFSFNECTTKSPIPKSVTPITTSNEFTKKYNS